MLIVTSVIVEEMDNESYDFDSNFLDYLNSFMIW